MKSCCKCAHDRDRTHESKSGISVLLTVSSTIECRIKLEISLSVALVTVTMLDGEWGVVSAVVMQEPRNLKS